MKFPETKNYFLKNNFYFSIKEERLLASKPWSL